MAIDLSHLNLEADIDIGILQHNLGPKPESGLPYSFSSGNILSRPFEVPLMAELQPTGAPL